MDWIRCLFSLWHSRKLVVSPVGCTNLNGKLHHLRLLFTESFQLFIVRSTRSQERVDGGVCVCAFCGATEIATAYICNNIDGKKWRRRRERTQTEESNECVFRKFIFIYCDSTDDPHTRIAQSKQYVRPARKAYHKSQNTLASLIARRNINENKQLRNYEFEEIARAIWF